MWIASKYGFFSVVNKDSGYHVRARCLGDLKLLRAAVGGDFAEQPIHETPDADYCARIFIPENSKAELHALFAALGESIDYGNFKDAIHHIPSQKSKLPFYTRVWTALYEFQRKSRP